MNKMILETERLFLREMNMDDYDALYAVLADPEIMQHYPYSFDEKRVSEWIERNMNRYKENGFGKLQVRCATGLLRILIIRLCIRTASTRM